MQGWLSFLNLMFWLSIINLLFNSKNMLTYILYAEICWIVIFCICILAGSSNNDLGLLSNCFFILAFAGIEFSFGFIIIILLKESNSSILLDNKSGLLDGTVKKKINKE